MPDALDHLHHDTQIYNSGTTGRNLLRTATPAAARTVLELGSAALMDSVDLHLQHGFNSLSDASLSFSAGTFTLAPTGSTFKIWNTGTEYNLSTKTVAIPNVTGYYFIYLDSSNVLQASTSAWDILGNAIPVATLHYYSPSGAYAPNDERHTAMRNRPWHKWAHDTIGTRYESGLSGTFTNTTLSITQGIIHDEDIEFSIGSTQTTCRLWRYSSANSSIYQTTELTPYLVSGGNLQYDNAGTAANVSVSSYVVNDVYATTDMQYPIWIRVGNAEYATLTLARAAANSTVTPWISFSPAELKLLYRVIYRNVGGTPTFVEAIDFRSTAGIPGGGTAPVAPHAATHLPAGSDPISGIALTNADNAFSVAQTIAGSAPSSAPGNGKAAVGAGIVVAANTGDVQLRLGNGADLDTYGFDIGRQGATSDATLGFLRFKGRQTGYSGYTFHTYGGEALRIDNSGTSTFYGAAPSSVSSGEVKIGGGYAYIYGGIQARTAGSDSVAGAAYYANLDPANGRGAIWQLGASRQLDLWMHNDSDWLRTLRIDKTGVSTFYGTAPSSVSSGQVAIGGGEIWSAGKASLGGGLIVQGSISRPSGFHASLVVSGSTTYFDSYSNASSEGPLVIRATSISLQPSGSQVSITGSGPPPASSGQVLIGGGSIVAYGNLFAGFSGNYGWQLGGYTASTITPTGKVTITINGTSYEIPAKAI